MPTAKDLLKDFASDLRETADPEVDLARSSITHFVEFVMRDKNGQRIKLLPFQQEMLLAMTHHRWLVIQAFRGASKSHFGSIMIPLWLLMHDRNLRIMILSASDVLSRGWLREIESYMMSPQYQKLAGNLIPTIQERRDQGLVWGQDQKIVAGRSPTATGPSLLAVGVHGQIRGRRTDVIIVDDIVTEANAWSNYQREGLESFFKAAVLPTLDHDPAKPLSGQVLYLCTPLFDNDLSATLTREWKDLKCQYEDCSLCQTDDELE